MTQPDLPSNLERFGLVAPPVLLGLIGRYQGGWTQTLMHDLFDLGLIGIALYLFLESSLPEKSRRRMALVALGLAGGIGLLA